MIALIGTTITPWGSFIQSYVVDKGLDEKTTNPENLEAYLASFCQFCRFLSLSAQRRFLINGIDIHDAKDAAGFKAVGW